MASKKEIRHQTQPLWHSQKKTPHFGCAPCPSLSLCGGLRIDAPAWDCLSLCKCNDETNCNFVCPRRPAQFVARMREIGGFDLTNVPHADPVSLETLPRVVSQIYDGSRRSSFLNVKFVAIPLASLYYRSTGAPRFADAQQIREAFRIDPRAKLLIIGVDDDPAIEPYWSKARQANIPQFLQSLKPAFVSTPNFSLFPDVPRWDNFHNMKRIAICWYEMAAAGLPTAIHLNARTDRDYARWKTFLRQHSEIQAVAFEYKTGGAFRGRGDWHTHQLITVGQSVERPISIVIRGGRHYIPHLRKGFSHVTLVTTEPFGRTVHRRKLHWAAHAAGEWRSQPTEKTESLDQLLQHNVDTYEQMIEHECCVASTA